MRSSAALLLVLLVMGCSREHARRRVVLVPIGPVPADVLAHLQRELPALVKSDVTIGEEIPLPPAALDRSRSQYRGTGLLGELEKRGYADADQVVGIIDEDAFAPRLNFIFGQARSPGRFAVVALPRLRESFLGHPDDAARFRERALKIATHELGHTFGFEHCPDRKCVMHFANSLREADETGLQYCSRERLPD